MSDKTYILTSEMDYLSFAWLDGLRREHFPQERNFLPAHTTLFHKLTIAQIVGLERLAVPKAEISLVFNKLHFIGAGVAVGIQSPELERLRTDIKVAMGGKFTRQDDQGWKPHVTIQNKVSADTARLLYHRLQPEFFERRGMATSLLVWEYIGGPWLLVKKMPFT